ncbi:MAG: adenylyl-sulfate kinase [Acidiferrobacteraceae bacterium]
MLVDADVRISTAYDIPLFYFTLEEFHAWVMEENGIVEPPAAGDAASWAHGALWHDQVHGNFGVIQACRCVRHMVGLSPASTGQALKQWSVGGAACRATGEKRLSLAPLPASENAQIFSPTYLKIFRRGSVLWFTGLSVSGTNTLAGLLARRLRQCDTRMITLFDEYVARRLFSKKIWGS